MFELTVPDLYYTCISRNIYLQVSSHGQFSFSLDKAETGVCDNLAWFRSEITGLKAKWKPVNCSLGAWLHIFMEKELKLKKLLSKQTNVEQRSSLQTSRKFYVPWFLPFLDCQCFFKGKILERLKGQISKWSGSILSQACKLFCKFCWIHLIGRKLRKIRLRLWWAANRGQDKVSTFTSKYNCFDRLQASSSCIMSLLQKVND